MNYPPNEGLSGTIADVMPDIQAYAHQSNGFVLELGVQYGDGSTVAIQRGLAGHPNPLHISVDIEDRMVWKPQVEWWHNIVADDTDQRTMWSVLALVTERYGERRPGLIFIDTIHSYEHMQQELALWSYVATDSTVWLFHDTWSCKGMTAAIREFAQANGWTYDDFRCETATSQCGLGRMRKR